jgi:hypothetical protein
VFFVDAQVAVQIVDAGITGGSFGPVLDHRTEGEVSTRRQLLITTRLPCVETSRLPTVTCRPKNEESAFEFFGGGQKRYPPDAPYCGAVKHHPPTSVTIDESRIVGAPDLFLTDERFGSGGSSFRLILASQRFVDFVRSRKLRGLAFEAVRLSGHSERRT